MPLILPGNVGSATAATGFNVANSARFRKDPIDELRLGAAGDNGDTKHWTVSMWIKRGKLGSLQHVWTWARNNVNADGGFAFDANDQIFLLNDGQNGGTSEIDGVFRDPLSWFHFVWSCDADNATNALRWRVYINGVERTVTGDPTISDAAGKINQGSSQDHWIGGRARSIISGIADTPFSGCIAEVVFIDDATLGPTSFGEFDDDSGIWKPIDVSGLTFGPKGYYLNFQDSAELGTDVSGNDYDFSETGLTAINQSLDTCTNNFPTLNPLFLSAATLNFTDANLTNNGVSSTAYRSAYGTIGVSTGKWYFEFRVNKVADSDMAVGIVHEDQVVQTASNGRFYTGTKGYGYGAADGDKLNNDADNGSGASYGSGFTSVGNIVGCALDLDNGKIYFSLNGTFQDSGDPTTGATGTGSAFDVTLGGFYFPAVTTENDDDRYSINFGSPPYANSSGNADGEGFGNFEYAVPSGYFAICSKNLAEYG